MEVTVASPSLLVRISLIVCHILVALLLRFLPKKLCSLLLPTSWHPPTPGPPPSPPSRRPAPMDRSELARVFQLFDRNGDGRITRAELADSLENLGIFIADLELAAMIEKVDTDGDGCVDEEEFANLYRAIMEEGRGEAEAEMQEAFEVFDQNGDGFISAEELRAVLVSLGLRQGRTAEDCRRMIGQVDLDGDGMVDFKEFQRMMKGQGGFAALS